MTDPEVNPALFRLRTFEEEWIAPLVARDLDDPLAAILLAEAEAWLYVGAEVGYFASPAASERIGRREAVSPRATEVIEGILGRRPAPGVTPIEFARGLSDAREDLTPGRESLLRRLLFNKDDEWRQAISEVEDVGARLVGGEFDKDLLERAAWALDDVIGSELAGDDAVDRSLPGGWRSGSLSLLAEWIPTLSDRLSMVDQVRANVRAAVDALTTESNSEARTDRGDFEHGVAAEQSREDLDVPVVGDPLISRAEIDRRVSELAAEISVDYAGRDLIIVGILKGAAIFAAHLVEELQVSAEMDWVRAASYGRGTESAGVVKVLDSIGIDIKHRDVLIVDDIVDTGLTLDAVRKELDQFGPATIEMCVLLQKMHRLRTDVSPRYVGFGGLPDEFVVGYGLDYRERFRLLDFIAPIHFAGVPSGVG